MWMWSAFAPPYRGVCRIRLTISLSSISCNAHFQYLLYRRIKIQWHVVPFTVSSHLAPAFDRKRHSSILHHLFLFLFYFVVIEFRFCYFFFLDSVLLQYVNESVQQHVWSSGNTPKICTFNWWWTEWTKTTNIDSVDSCQSQWRQRQYQQNTREMHTPWTSCVRRRSTGVCDCMKGCNGFVRPHRNCSRKYFRSRMTRTREKLTKTIVTRLLSVYCGVACVCVVFTFDHFTKYHILFTTDSRATQTICRIVLIKTTTTTTWKDTHARAHTHSCHR